MPSNYLTNDPIEGAKDLDDVFITDAWLVDQFVGGTLFGWGLNNNGQLGNNTDTNPSSSPVQVGALTNWKQVSCGDGHTMAVKTDGTLWAWGRNDKGQLGSGNVTKVSSPIQIGSLTNWKQVAELGDGYNTMFIKTDGTLWACGYNNYGQLGNGTLTYYSSPIQIGSLTNWKQVSCGRLHSGSVKTDGTLWVWGNNGYGVLGLNHLNSSYSSPIQVGLLTNWKQVSCHNESSAAIKTDGTLWTWGRSFYGGLGNGTTISYSSPIQVGLLTNWKQVCCGDATVAIKTDGTLWTWGNNNYGMLGNGTIIHYSSPIQVGALTNWKQVLMGYYGNSFAAIKTDGTLWTCGYNFQGQLGNGTRVYYSSPIQVGSLTNWKQVAISRTVFGITYKDLG